MRRIMELRKRFIYGSKGFYAVEVKNSDKIYSKDLTPLKNFKWDYPESKGYLFISRQR